MGWLQQPSWSSSAADHLAQASRLEKHSGERFFSDSLDVLQKPQGFVLGQWWESQPRAMALSGEDECEGCGRAARVMFWNIHTVVSHSQPKNLEGLF